MSLFSSWFGFGKDESPKIANQTVIKETELVTRHEVEQIAKRYFKDRIANMHHVNVSITEKGSFKLVRKGGVKEAGWFFTGRPVLFEKEMEIEELLEYLKQCKEVSVRFEGPYENTKSLLEKLDTEWYRRQNSVLVDVNDDGLESFGIEEQRSWALLILRIFRNFNEDMMARQNIPKEMRVASGRYVQLYPQDRYRKYETCVGIVLHSFEVYCRGMAILPYDMIEDKLLYGDKIINNIIPIDWKAAQRVIRKHADHKSFTEEENRIECVIGGRKLVVKRNNVFSIYFK